MSNGMRRPLAHGIKSDSPWALLVTELCKATDGVDGISAHRIAEWTKRRRINAGLESKHQISHASVNDLFSGKPIKTWEKVEAVVVVVGADLLTVRALWLIAMGHVSVPAEVEQPWTGFTAEPIGKNPTQIGEVHRQEVTVTTAASTDVEQTALTSPPLAYSKTTSSDSDAGADGRDLEEEGGERKPRSLGEIPTSLDENSGSESSETSTTMAGTGTDASISRPSVAPAIGVSPTHAEEAAPRSQGGRADREEVVTQAPLQQSDRSASTPNVTPVTTRPLARSDLSVSQTEAGARRDVDKNPTRNAAKDGDAPGEPLDVRPGLIPPTSRTARPADRPVGSEPQILGVPEPRTPDGPTGALAPRPPVLAPATTRDAEAGLGEHDRVYVVSARAQYHRAWCEVFRHENREAEFFGDIVQKGYSPCQVCRPPAAIWAPMRGRIQDTGSRLTPALVRPYTLPPRVLGVADGEPMQGLDGHEDGEG